MDTSGKSVRDPAAHQPSKSEIEKDARVDATPEALAWAVTRGGSDRRAAPRQKDDAPTQ